MRYLWAVLGLISMGLALIGVLLPLLPTVPFLLLAAFFFSRSSERLHTWLISHRVFGPLIIDWHTSGIIRPRSKRVATVSIVAVFAISLAIGLRPLLLGIQATVLCCVLFFIWSRPSH